MNCAHLTDSTLNSRRQKKGTTKEIPNPPLKAKIFVTLDGLVHDANREVFRVAEQLNILKGSFGFRVDLNFLDRQHNQLGSLRDLVNLRRPLFADLKMWNAARITELAIQLAKRGVDYIGIYSLASSELSKVTNALKGYYTEVLAVTVLPHHDEAHCRRWFKQSLAEHICHMTKMAMDTGCGGVILPASMLSHVSEIKIAKVVHTRPDWYPPIPFQVEATPAEAMAQGASTVVCGGLIKGVRGAGLTPKDALERIISETA